MYTASYQAQVKFKCFLLDLESLLFMNFAPGGLWIVFPPCKLSTGVASPLMEAVEMCGLSLSPVFLRFTVATLLMFGIYKIMSRSQLWLKASRLKTADLFGIDL